MNGEYSEELKSGGKLVVTASSIKIAYYFSGPDLRYNGQWIYIPYDKIDDYINAYKENFQKYQMLMNTIPKDGQFSTIGKCNMKIQIGSQYHNGVTIAEWYNHLYPSVFPIKKDSDVEIIISDYEYCKIRGKEVQKLLFNK